ncbi:Frequency clock protein [Talaromyces islandicus]|uniref:Frequency clock protein n=1 Tax=Talaromyces islandicus TaxID=28573 RepID=A0A0U1LXP6_TALIS|nr:Frequency clock protein [Talaromyces islandicus]
MSPTIPPEVFESSQDKSASDHWFDNVNHKVTSQIDGLKNGSPVFVDNIDIQIGEKDATVALEDPVLSYIRTNDWERENEELRGIIDDLTLDVKRMKRKLRRYREANPRHLRDDKLFEIRTHCLSIRRKRQLENLLERFAADISVPPGLLKDKSLPRVNSLLSKDTRMGMLAMLIECLCSPNASHHASSLKSSLLQGNRGGWFSINEMLDCIEQASSAVSQHKFCLEALKEHSTRLVISEDGNYLRWKAATDVPVESSVTQAEIHVDNEITAKSRNSTRVPLGSDKMDVMSTIKKDPYYTPSVFLQNISEAEVDGLSMSYSEVESVTQVAVVYPVPQASKSSKLSSSTPHGRTAYYKDASFYIDYSCDSLDHADICQEPHKYDKNRECQWSSENHVSDRFAVYQTEHKENNDKQYDTSSPDLSFNDEPLSPITDGARVRPIELEAPGVGSVIPNDNFVVHVTVKHTSVPVADAVKNNTDSRVPNNRLSRDSIIPRPEIHSTFKSHVVASIHEELAPSPLPPPTYRFFSSASSDDEDESLRSELSHGGYGIEKPTHAASIQKWSAEVVSSLEHDTDGAVSGVGEDIEAT